MIDRLLRAKDIIGDKKKGIPAIFPISEGTFYEMIKDGRFPKPLAIGTGSKCCKVWKESTVQQWMDNLQTTQED